MTSQTTRQIIEQLKETSHPPIVLLDGDWGIGKTHLIENELRPMIKSDENTFGDYHYISAFGISSVSEFQDKVISLHISNNAETSDYFESAKKYSGKVAKFFGADSNASGLIQGAISGVSKYVRQKALEDMTNFTLVVDDLERLSDKKLLETIMGSCLRFAEHNGIKVIVVANSKALEDKAKVEKVFSDVIKLTRTTDELLSIVEEIYEGKLNTPLKQALFQTLQEAGAKKLDAANLRVIQRAINRTIKLNNKLKDIEEIIEDRTTEIIAQQIVTISLFCYSHKLDLDTLLSIKENATKWTVRSMLESYQTATGNKDEKQELTKDEQHQYDLYEQLNSLFLHSPINWSFAQYCFTNVIPDLTDKEYITYFSLPRIRHPFDIYRTGSIYSFKSEDDFELAIKEVEKLLFKGTSLNWFDWLTCCDRFLLLHEKGYLPPSDIESTSKKVLDRVLMDGVINLDTVDRESVLDIRFYSSLMVSPQFNEVLNKVYARNKSNLLKKLEEAFRMDWKSAYESARSDIQSEPFFHVFDLELFAQAITQWDAQNINQFLHFIVDRYRIENNPVKDQKELPALKDLVIFLKREREVKTGRLIRGALYELINGLNEAISILENRQIQ
ncbi:P-loop NTPase fold protein [Pseudoalteromonas rubra]|uniref:KAP NTPase domain-containing protein n=1 Tax=Pseudoalteromonas rubra TaxID=43658 RepID=A0A0F4R0G2_9GAMM|nr:P-loop NTPase fold protein [Pseudoalteromonas rubra]KJZ13005.1 hypothetical protein TW77_01325 [Pseudoalteromonas rubra]